MPEEKLVTKKPRSPTKTEVAIGESVRSERPKPEVNQLGISFYVLLGAALFVFSHAFELLSPILL